MSSSKTLSCKGTLRQVFIFLRPRTTYPHYKLYTCIQYIIIHTGKGVGGGRVEPQRRLEGQQFTKLGRKYKHE
jgi:hypothetical protein